MVLPVLSIRRRIQDFQAPTRVRLSSIMLRRNRLTSELIRRVSTRGGGATLLDSGPRWFVMQDRGGRKPDGRRDLGL